MANNVIFLKGTAANYTALESKNPNTFYYTTDDAQLYLGSIKLSNGSDLAKAVERIAKNEEDIQSINEALDTIQGDENVTGSVKNLIKAAKTELEGKITAVDNKVGSLETLETTDKDSIVDAINEVRRSVSAGGTAATISLSESDSEDYAKVYTLKQGENTVGTINIPKDMVVKSGTIVTEDGEGNQGTFIKLVLANATNDELYINVGTLVDIYKAAENATQVQLAIDSSTREISATIVAGSIGTTELADNAIVTAKIADGNVTKAKLSTAVQTSLDKADSALQAADIVSGTANGTIAVDGTDVAVTGLKSAAYADATSFDAAGSASAVLGAEGDTADKATVYGVKAYAAGLDAAMDTRVDALEAAIGQGGSVDAQIDAKIANLDATVKSADVEAGKGIQVEVIEADGKLTSVSVSGNYDEKYDAKGAAAQALVDAKAEIAKLDVEDTAVAGKYVSAVSEADGKITVTRADLPQLEWGTIA